MSDRESDSKSKFYYPKDEEQAKTEQKKKGHVIDNFSYYSCLFGHYREISDLRLDVLTSLSLSPYTCTSRPWSEISL